LRTLSLCFLCCFLAFAQDTPTLDPAQPLEKDISPKAVHSYRFQADQGQFIYLLAEQLQGDIQLTLRDPGGKRLTILDRYPAPAIEDLPWIAPQSGTYTVDVTTGEEATGTNHYRLALQNRIPTDADRTRCAAFQATWVEAYTLVTDPKGSGNNAAIAKLQQALPDWRKIADRRWEGYALELMGVAYNRLSQFTQARDTLLQALALRRAEPTEKVGLGIVLNSLGSALDNLDDRSSAVKYLEEALAIRESMGLRKPVAIVLTNLGLLYNRMGNFEKDLAYQQRALAIRREIGDKAGIASNLNLIGRLHSLKSEFQTAIEYHDQALALRREVKDRRGQASTLNDLGQLYYLLGDMQSSRDYLRQSAALADELGDIAMIASAQYHLGRVSAWLGEHTAAIAYFQRAIEIRRKTGSNAVMAPYLIFLGNSYIGTRDYTHAREVCTQALDFARTGTPIYTSMGLTCLGKVAMETGDLETARKNFEEVLARYRKTDGKDDVALALTLLARAQRDAGHLDDALLRIEEASSLGDEVRRGITYEGLRASFHSVRIERAELTIDILTRLHKQHPGDGFDVRAFESAEKSKARTLNEILTAGTVRAKPLTPEQSAKQAAMATRISALQKELFQSSPPLARQQDLRRELSAAEQERDLFHANVFGIAAQSDILNLQRIQQEVLVPGTALVFYFLAKEKSYAWVVTTNGLTSAELPNRKTVEEKLEAYRSELSQRVSSLTATSALSRLDTLGQGLYQMLLAPLAPALTGTKTLIVSPDGALAYLPFETLPAPDRTRLLERFAMRYAPSASTLSALRLREKQRTKPSKMLLAFADPAYELPDKRPPAIEAAAERGLNFVRLPYTRAEATAIQSLFAAGSTKTYFGVDAREHAVKTETLADYRYLHFAAHGYFDEERPSRSGIALAFNSADGEDGVLQANEIAQLKLNADLVTLSACRSGLGSVMAGEGVMGLSRAFLDAGAQGLMVSLWNVNDEATATLMKSFYRNLNRGLTREEALRQAKLSLLHSTVPAWRHPYFWAPFVLQGL